MKKSFICSLLLVSTLVSACSSGSSGSSRRSLDIAIQSTLNLDETDGGNSSLLFNIWFFSADGTEVTPLTTVTTTTVDALNPDLSFDGTKVVFQSSQATDASDALNTNSVTNIWSVNVDGTDLTALTNLTASSAHSTAPRWSPDGNQIAFFSQRNLDGTNAAGPESACNVWVMDADGANQTALTNLTADDIECNGRLEWSPDGSKILYISTKALDGSDASNTRAAYNIWVINSDGSDDTPLTTNEELGVDSFIGGWSPDGTQIVFRSSAALDGSDATNTNSTSNIWIIDADGSNKTPLTDLEASGATCTSPSFSADGTKVAYTSLRNIDGTDSAGDNFNIWLINTDGTSNTVLTPYTTLSPNFGAFLPRFRSDGTLVFISTGALDGTDASNTNDAANIWTADSDGSNVTPFTSYEGNDISMSY